jgi:hypothetical protein
VNAWVSRLRAVVVLLRHGHVSPVWRALRRRLASRSDAYGLRRDLEVPFAAPDAKVPIRVRAATPDDEHALRRVDPEATGADLYELRSRVRMLEAGLGTCYAAVDEEGRTLYVQWLIPASENDRIQEHFRGAFPPLGPDEALLEGAFTFASARGQRVMPAAMARISEGAAHLGARCVITFVRTDNEPSLKGCERAGFSPYVLRRERWSLFRRRLSFEPLPPGPAQELR